PATSLRPDRLRLPGLRCNPAALGTNRSARGRYGPRNVTTPGGRTIDDGPLLVRADPLACQINGTVEHGEVVARQCQRAFVPGEERVRAFCLPLFIPTHAGNGRLHLVHR